VEVRILAQRATTTPNKWFSALTFSSTHALNTVLYIAVKMLLLLNWFFPLLQVKNKQCDRVTRYVFILVPIRAVANKEDVTF
jgi:hypothetical protein